MATFAYSALKFKIQPLDLILFGVPGRFTHAGLIVTSEFLPEVKTLVPGKHYVLETLQKGEQSGFQIRDIQTLPSPVSWGHLNNNPWRVIQDKTQLIATMHTLFARYVAQSLDSQPISCCHTKPQCQTRTIHGRPVYTSIVSPTSTWV